MDTPEGVALDFVLAGLGSRAAAAAIDIFIQASILASVLFMLAVVAPFTGLGLVIGLVSLAVFATLYGYGTYFEGYRNGRTPGKEVIGLRVIRDDGSAVDLRAAAIRSLLMLVDGPLTLWLGGAISVVVSGRNRRLGDIIAGTLVIRERFADALAAPPPPQPHRRRAERAPTVAIAASPPQSRTDLTGVREADLVVVRRFLERRAQLEPQARARLAAKMQTRLMPRVAGLSYHEEPEVFLERLVREAPSAS